jgi:hypothetical protein
MGNRNSSCQNKNGKKGKADTVYSLKKNDVDSIYNAIEEMQKKFQISSSGVAKIDIYADTDRGIFLPYIVDKDAFSFAQKMFGEDKLDSETPHYLEFITCNQSVSDINEKYRVHHRTPDHVCRGNCKCIAEMYEVRKSKYQPAEDLDVPSIEFVTATPTIEKKTLYGGKKDDLSPTSDDDDDVSSTSENDEDYDNNDDDFSETSDTDEVKKKKKQKKNNEEDDKVDEDDLDDDIDDESDDANRINFEQSDVSTSDLYEMSKRLFVSSDGGENTDDSDTSDYGLDGDDESVERFISQNMSRPKRNNLFDSEERDILDMNSSSSIRPTKKMSTRHNSKYH